MFGTTKLKQRIDELEARLAEAHRHRQGTGSIDGGSRAEPRWHRAGRQQQLLQPGGLRARRAGRTAARHALRCRIRHLGSLSPVLERSAGRTLLPGTHQASPQLGAGCSGWRATYNPIIDPRTGKATKIIKFASDVTARVEEAARSKALVDAIERSMAVIEFTPDGRILRANDNFLAVMGYRAAEVIGQHHRMFCTPEQASSLEYNRLWDTLRSGRFLSGQFSRINKRGEQVWLEASYNPVLDAGGKVERVVKTASDVTPQEMRRQAEREASAMASAAAQDTEHISSEGETIIFKTIAKIQAIAQAVEKATTEVTALGQRTTEISSITKTIKEIADQTNLLALNAAIEAARAGESAAAASPSSPTKCAGWPSAPPTPPPRSPTWWRASRPKAGRSPPTCMPGSSRSPKASPSPTPPAT